MENEIKFDFLKNYDSREHEKIKFYNIDTGIFEEEWHSVDEIFRKEKDNIGKELFAISYSFGTPFFANIIQKFNYSEILVGNEKLLLDAMIKGSLMNDLQKDMIELLAKNDNEKIILNYMEQKKLKIYIPKTIKFHNKLYLMNFDDNQKRVYTGSSNMSDTAHSKFQGEMRYISNRQENYDKMFKEYEDIKFNNFEELKFQLYYDVSNDEHYFDKHPDKLPYLSNIDSKHPLIADITKQPEAPYVLDYNATEEKIKKHDEIERPKPKFIDKTKKQVLLDSDYKKAYCEAIIGSHNYNIGQEVKKSYPLLDIDYNQNNIFLNSILYNKDVTIEEVKNDYDILLKIMNGFEFYSLDPILDNVHNAQKELFKFLVWGFLTPFIQEIRKLAFGLHLDYTTSYPRFGFIMGASTNGKSKFTLLITKFISNKFIDFSDKKKFSEKGLQEFANQKSNMPVLFDDLVFSFESKSILKMIKNDKLDTGIPAVIFTINEENITKTETNRRMFSVYSEFKGINEKQTFIDNFSVLEIIKEQATNSLFSKIAYKYILPKITYFREKIENKERVSYEEFDFYKIVSQAFIELWKEIYQSDPIPDYIQELKVEDLRFDLEINETTKEQLYNWLKTKPEYFKIQEDMIIISDSKNPKNILELMRKMPSYIKKITTTDGFEVKKIELEDFLNIELYTQLPFNKGKILYKAKKESE